MMVTQRGASSGMGGPWHLQAVFVDSVKECYWAFRAQMEFEVNLRPLEQHVWQCGCFCKGAWHRNMICALFLCGGAQEEPRMGCSM